MKMSRVKGQLVIDGMTMKWIKKAGKVQEKLNKLDDLYRRGVMDMARIAQATDLSIEDLKKLRRLGNYPKLMTPKQVETAELRARIKAYVERGLNGLEIAKLEDRSPCGLHYHLKAVRNGHSATKN